MKRLHKIRCIAVDTNGVLLNDVYAASLRRFVESEGGVYTAELESIVLGAPHLAGGHALSVACGLPLTAQECIDRFLAAHRGYSASTPVRLEPGAEAFLERLASLDVRITTYGGRPRERMLDEHLGPCLRWLDARLPYVDIDAVRPGMKEIARGHLGCRCDEVLFVDDLAKVALACRRLGSGFIGLPGTPFQRERMLAAGAGPVVDSLGDIDADAIRRVDERLAARSSPPAAARLLP